MKQTPGIILRYSDIPPEGRHASRPIQCAPHTPPPWRVGVNPGPIIYGPHGEQIADMRADLLPVGERGQNVRLIAAAPELLAEAAGLWTAATQALAMLERHDPGTAAAIRADFAQHLRRPAITRATGATAGFPA